MVITEAHDAAETRSVRHPDRFFIDGEWTRPSSDSRFRVINPTTENLLAEVADAQAADMKRAVAAARDAFDNGPWRKMSPAERGGYVRKIGEAIQARSDEAARLWSSEMGVTRQITDFMIPMSLGGWFDYADIAESFAFEERVETRSGAQFALHVHEPVGVVGAIIPWNAPQLMIAYKLAPALVAGCTTILKASPEAPLDAYLVAEAAEEIGLPKGVLNVVTADRSVSELLVRNPDVDKISFTGSTAAGRAIGSICGGRIARCTLELGGKSAAILFDDYDVAAAAQSLAMTTSIQTGQVCAALTRIIVPTVRHDDVVEALAQAFSKIRIGDPLLAETEMGPLATSRQRDRVEDYIRTGMAEGAVLASGGRRPASHDCGWFIEPTVFARADNSMRIAREEIFGPVVCVIPYQDEEEALRIANDSPYGLAGALFTNDAEKAYHAMRELRTGTVSQNAMLGDFSIGFGGFKQSGIGREGGVEGLRHYLESKTALLQSVPARFR